MLPLSDTTALQSPHPKHTLPFGNAGATTALKDLLNFPAKTAIRYGWTSSLLFYGNKNMEKGHTSPQTAELVVTIGTSNQVCWPLLLQTLPSLLSQVDGLAVGVSAWSSCLNWSVSITEVCGCNPDGQTLMKHIKLIHSRSFILYFHPATPQNKEPQSILFLH